jgi:predicted dehydrogenase
MSPSATLSLAIVGAGDIASRHADALREENGVRLAAVAEPDAGRRTAFAERYGIKQAVADYRQLLRDETIGAVLILTPHHLHHPMVVEALRARKHVICEKPMARTVAECDAMLAEAASSGAGLYVTHSLRTDFFYRTASRRIAEGAVGRLVLGSFRWFTDEIARLDDPRHWKGTVDRSGGGVFIDGGCHVADLGNAFFGRARQVAAGGSRLVAALPDRGEDNGCFIVEYSSGASCAFSLSFTAGKAFRRERFGAGMNADLYGTEGHLEGGYLLRDTVFQRWCTEHRPGADDLRHPPPEGEDRVIDRDFLRSIREGAPSPVTALDARNAVAVVEAAYRSMRSGRIQEVDWRA